MLTSDPSQERYLLPFQQDLAKIGITMTLRSVDTPQFVERIRNRDFEMIVGVWGHRPIAYSNARCCQRSPCGTNPAKSASRLTQVQPSVIASAAC